MLYVSPQAAHPDLAAYPRAFMPLLPSGVFCRFTAVDMVDAVDGVDSVVQAHSRPLPLVSIGDRLPILGFHGSLELFFRSKHVILSMLSNDKTHPHLDIITPCVLRDLPSSLFLLLLLIATALLWRLHPAMLPRASNQAGQNKLKRHRRQHQQRLR